MLTGNLPFAQCDQTFGGNATLTATIKRLKVMSQSLRHAAECPARSHMQCPTFQRLLKAAIGGRLKPPAKAVSRSGRQP